MTSNLDACSKRNETLHSSPGTPQKPLEAHVWEILHTPALTASLPNLIASPQTLKTP